MKRTALLLAMAALLATPVCGVRAQGASDPRPPQDRAREGVREGRFMPLGKVIAIIRGRTPGRQLDVDLDASRGRPAYIVRWAADDGRRIDYVVDAQSGAVLSANGE